MNSNLEPYIPYIGNKFGIVDNIYDTLKTLNIPRPAGIIDAFCGGGSFAYFMAAHGYHVVANDIEKGLIRLHKLIAKDFSKVQKFSRKPYTYEAFHAIKNKDTAEAAFARSIWSFSNTGNTYLTSPAKQYEKIVAFKAGRGEPCERYRHIEDIFLLGTRTNLNIDWVCGSYEDLTVPEGYLCYCDPPYKGTAKYRNRTFDHDKFYAWALAQPGLVLISEYDMPEPFVLLDSYTKICDAGGNKKRKWAVERLYANKPVPKLSLF